MIYWYTGNSGSGKSTMAKALYDIFDNGETEYIDGDTERNNYKNKLGFSEAARWEHNIRIAKKAKKFSDEGKDVYVAVICPYKELRGIVKEITNCQFVYLEGGKDHIDYPYEHPELY